MCRRRLKRLLVRPRGSRAAWLALLGQFVALVGLPLPAISAKDLSQPFPCQHRQCGCMRAADCWGQCCCFSARERLAWARAHDAEVPDQLVREAEEGQDAASSNCCLPDSGKAPKAAKRSAGGVLGIMARQCQGGETPWSGGEPSMMPAPIESSTCASPAVDRVKFGQAHFTFLEANPPEPPPRG